MFNYNKTSLFKSVQGEFVYSSGRRGKGHMESDKSLLRIFFTYYFSFNN